MDDVQKALDLIRTTFNTEVDEETLKDNERKIQEWQHALTANSAYAGWVEHDITRQIAQKTRESYKSAALTLSHNRTLTDQQRHALWALQDANLWLLSITERDAKGELAQIHHEIEAALNATN